MKEPCCCIRNNVTYYFTVIIITEVNNTEWTNSYFLIEARIKSKHWSTPKTSGLTHFHTPKTDLDVSGSQFVQISYGLTLLSVREDVISIFLMHSLSAYKQSNLGNNAKYYKKTKHDYSLNRTSFSITAVIIIL